MVSSTRLLTAGFLMMALSFGVSRFYYAPLLPIMLKEYNLDVGSAGWLASANFAGYLFGALLCSAIAPGPVQLFLFRLGILASVLTTIGMGLTQSVAIWTVLRTIAGISNAFALVFGAQIIFAALAAAGQETKLGWIYGGVGFGIAASGVLVRLGHPPLNASELWIAAGIGLAVIAPFVLLEIGSKRLIGSSKGLEDEQYRPRPLPFWPLLIGYSLGNVGYSIFGTFIVVIVKSKPGLEVIGDWVWILTGLAAIPSGLIWARLGKMMGFAWALLLAFVLQALTMLMPAIFSGGWAGLLAATLFGLTFASTTTLALPLGMHGLGGRGFAILTLGGGLALVIGPLVVAAIAKTAGDYWLGLTIAAGTIAAGCVFLLFAIWLGRTPVPLRGPAPFASAGEHVSGRMHERP